MNDESTGSLTQEMRAVKMLLILQLLNAGVKQKQIALMLGISEASMSSSDTKRPFVDAICAEPTTGRGMIWTWSS